MLIAVEAHYKVKPIIYTKGIMTILKEEFSGPSFGRAIIFLSGKYAGRAGCFK
jgi:hypothetical protein